jgi:hypothetical protein
LVLVELEFLELGQSIKKICSRETIEAKVKLAQLAQHRPNDQIRKLVAAKID